jgi:hypothetical protein
LYGGWRFGFERCFAFLRRTVSTTGSATSGSATPTVCSSATASPHEGRKTEFIPFDTMFFPVDDSRAFRQTLL